MVHKIFPTPTAGANPNFWYGTDHNKLINHLHNLDKSDPFTFTVDQDTFKHSTTNVAGDLLKNDGTRYSRLAKGTAGQVLQVNVGATDLEWADPDTAPGSWDPDAVETVNNKTFNVTDNTLTADSIALSDLLVSDGTRFSRRAKGTSNQILKMAANGNDIEWGVYPIGAIRGGSISFSGDSSNKIFNIPHTLTAGTPDLYFAHAKTVAALGNYTYSASSTNITITYITAPATGTNNLTYVWGAGYSGLADTAFSPTTTNTVTNKTMSGATNTFSAIPMSALAGGHLIFTKISVPADQANHEDGLVYLAEIDVNNNGLFTKVQKNDQIFEVPVG